ncbi:MAG TPA: acyl-CoA dehydrogenase family protein [Solirubrobacteraceae bacterium]|jgi:alkylation response protein AidB-like acyl-CoA dehydrogenase
MSATAELTVEQTEILRAIRDFVERDLLPTVARYDHADEFPAALVQKMKRADLEAGMAKLFATEVAEEAALEAMRIHGGYGYPQEYPIERLYRDAAVLILGEGSNEIQQLLIARRIFERYETGAR